MSRYIGRQGKYRTISLFVETVRNGSDYEPVFFLKARKHNASTGIKSLYKIYMDCGDPTGYEAAMEALGSWEHWRVLREQDWFDTHITMWEEELIAKIKAQALKLTISISSDREDKRSLQASRYLLSEGWKVKKAGRPSKADIENNNKRSNSLKALVAEDAERLGLL